MGLPDTGDIEDDLRAWLRGYAVLAADPCHAPLVLALTAAAAESPRDAEGLYQQLTGPRHEALVERLRRAVDAGQVRADADLDAVADAVTGALLYQLLTGNAAASERRAAALVDILLGGLRATPGGA